MKKITIFILFLLTFCCLHIIVEGQQTSLIGDISTDATYLIITPNNDGIRQWADTLAQFRNEQGIATEVIGMNEIGENSPIVLKKYLKEYYNQLQGLGQQTAILLLGDYNNDPTKGITSFYLQNHLENNIHYLTDNKLVDFDDDNLPEICIARLPATNAEQAELMVKKTIRYEREPSTNPDYYHRPVTAMGFEEERWFQLCSEVVAGYFENKGKEPYRLNSIYSGTPDSVWSTNENTNLIIDYFGSNGLNYIPDNLQHITDWSANQEDLSDAINNGTFLIQHRDHGIFQSWNNPYFSNNEINNLYNEDLTFIMSANCQTGDFGYGEGDNDCFAERFLRIENGAVAIVAASQISYSYVNDTYVWGFFDYLWNDFMPDYGSNDIEFKYPAFANVYGKKFLKQSKWPYLSIHKDITYNLFHYFGDAYLQLNTEIPQEINISYPKEILTDCSSFTISKDDKTRVAFSVDGKLLATSFGKDSLVNIKPFHKEGKIKVVATKQDHYRHEGYIHVKSYLNHNDLNIYPNPATDIVYIEGKEIKEVMVYNTLGQMLIKINNNAVTEKMELNCSNLKKGLFHLHIIYEDKRVVKSLVVM